MNMKRFQSPTGMTLSMMFIYLINGGAPSTSATITCLFTLTLCLFSTNSTTGLAIAVGAATTICVQPIWGRMATRAKPRTVFFYLH